MSSRKTKKSETLEVRLSYETKCALKDQATKEGLTLSAWVRLALDQSLAKQTDTKPRRNIPSYIKPLLQRPRLIAASTTSLIAMTVLGQSASYAEDLQLQIKGHITQEDTYFTFDKDCRMAAENTCEFKVTGPSQFLVKVERLESEQDINSRDGTVLFKIDLLLEEEENGRAELIPIMTPRLRVQVSQTATIEVGSGEDSSVRISITPEYLQALY